MAIPQKLLLRQKLQRSAREWLKIYREELKKKRPHGLGKDGQPKSPFSPVSADSIGSGNALEADYEIVTNDDGTYDVVFNIPDYIYYQDQGIRGGRFKSGKGTGKTSPFISSLTKWIETKHIKTELSTLGLAIAIRRSIFNEGIEATNILSIVNQRFLEEWGSSIANDYMENMENYIIDYIQKVEEKNK